MDDDVGGNGVGDDDEHDADVLVEVVAGALVLGVGLGRISLR